MTLKVGRIDYANCTPIFEALQTHSDGCEYRLIRGVPATLNMMLAHGEIDLCPASSIEYGKNPDSYYLLPDISISSIGPVRSVLLFSRLPLEELRHQTIGLTTESETSVNLLKILFAVNLAIPAFFERCTLPLHQALAKYSALLLIGDSALAESGRNHDLFVYDMGELWYRFTGLPFVFALWIVRKEAVRSYCGEVKAISEALIAAKQLAYDSYADIAVHARERLWMGEKALVEYWRTISYDLTPRHLEGLRLFFRLAADINLLPEAPDIRMFPDGRVIPVSNQG
ncbi:MAG: menaquinone biosynthesis protein [Geobacteraceae bacterium]